MKEFSRLNSSKEFNKIYSKPTHTWHTKCFVLFYKEAKTKEVAFIASKKVGKAVLRNRARRLLKAHFITYSSSLKSGKYIFVAKSPILDSNYHNVNRVFKKIYTKLKLFIN